MPMPSEDWPTIDWKMPLNEIAVAALGGGENPTQKEGRGLLGQCETGWTNRHLLYCHSDAPPIDDAAMNKAIPPKNWTHRKCLMAGICLCSDGPNPFLYPFMKAFTRCYKKHFLDKASLNRRELNESNVFVRLHSAPPAGSDGWDDLVEEAMEIEIESKIEPRWYHLADTEKVTWMSSLTWMNVREKDCRPGRQALQAFEPSRVEFCGFYPMAHAFKTMCLKRSWHITYYRLVTESEFVPEIIGGHVEVELWPELPMTAYFDDLKMRRRSKHPEDMIRRATVASMRLKDIYRLSQQRSGR